MFYAQQVIEILKRMDKVIEENKLYLSELDAAIGDGDHGLNMSKGFKSVIEKIKDAESDDLGEILKKAGMALVSNVGGASGPLYGTAFLKASNVLKGKNEVDIILFKELLKEAISGIQMRGKAELDDKTMLDAFIPAYEALDAAIKEEKGTLEALERMKDAAVKGAEHTAQIIARKGRASYVGERSIGHKDAGAVSSMLLLSCIYEYVKEA